MSIQFFLLFFFIIILSFSKPVSLFEFIFNTNFSSTNLLTYGNATIESSILTLTSDTKFSIGRAFYPLRIIAREPNSSTPLTFSTSFIFSIAPYKNLLPGHGFAFVFFPSTGIEGASSAQHLGLFNFTNNGNSDNHVLAVEFDTFRNQEFNDLNDNHVGIDVNSLTSMAQKEAGFWAGKDNEKFKELKLNNGVNYQVWIDYVDSRINVTMAKAGEERPKRPLISEFVNLTEVLLDEMYIGFCGATGRLVQSHRILSWSFSNTSFSIGNALVTRNLPSFGLPKKSVFKSEGFIIGISVAGVVVIGFGIVMYEVLARRRRRQWKEKQEMEDWELEYWPHRIDYQQISAATKGFAEENVIGFGGNGKVYKGTLECGAEVAVKRISHQSEKGTREFLAEVSSLGRLKHRNLVGMRGWCKQHKESLMLLYDYMENGSLDKRLFNFNLNSTLSWEERIKILKDVANGILYLHEGWEAKVLHRDIKASNVLLDKDMNARLGDFGLARVHHHGQLASTTQVVGTVGYMAPEVIRTGRASTQTDVFSFGVLLLEVVCGRRPSEVGKPGLVEFVWRLMEKGELINAIDERLKAMGGYNNEEVERVLQLGLLCAYPDASARPAMRQVVKVLEGSSDGSECIGEEMEVHLLDGIRRTRMWSSSSQQHHHAYPTMDGIFSSLSLLSSSDIISEGR
ncbi:probable L-type lectin-domain containing receptor kinase VII.2 [Ricinus communis]|nr:probable L-type lectin-domain containing receptor kinase VII.2 [Ricinus communis]